VKILLDTDILIDFALDRRPHGQAAGDLIDLLERRVANGFIAWHSASNFYYLVSSARGRNDTRRFLSDLTSFVDVAPTTTDSLRAAAGLPVRDFEDAMQVAAALACGADVIATRNSRDYRRSPVKSETARSLVRRLSSNR
jgi:predicted nucleic acid-binding protein